MPTAMPSTAMLGVADHSGLISVSHNTLLLNAKLATAITAHSSR
jgi:hypothetical protein